jgi:hypothetical protein
MILRHFRLPISSIFTMNRLSFPFSTYFEEKDKLEFQKLTPPTVYYKPYQKMIDLWKKPLEKKRLRQERIK